MSDTDLDARLFGKNFKWGVSSAAFQVEGGSNEGGKGPSIWDIFTHKNGKICHGQHADTACDFYHRYAEDIAALQSLGIPNFRFSISWSRILPEGTGKINQEGVAFYNRVIDCCLAAGIEPWVTLYHWDLPQELELRGGWTNREIISWFSEYTEVCARQFGDRVKYWMVMNEPMVFTGAGHFMGVHAPGRKGLANFLPAVHHAVLCMAAGGRILKELLPGAEVGTTFSCSHIEPWKNIPVHAGAARRVDALLNRLFIEPVLGLGYPVEDAPVLARLEKYMLAGDEQLMKFDFDFIGVQNYTREVIRYSIFTPYIRARMVRATHRNVPLTEMDWEVYPASIYHCLKKFDRYAGIRKLIVTENGAAFPDRLHEGEVHDETRTAFLKAYIEQVGRAKQEGCKVEGYFVWTLTDNFEWAEGYRPRFGLIYVDFEDQRRIIKDSGKWYSGLIRQARALT